MLPYPQSTFEALFVKAVNRRNYLKELVDALLIIEVSKLLESLLDLFSKSLRLADMRGKEKRVYHLRLNLWRERPPSVTSVV